MRTLGTDLPKEIARVRELIKVYDSIPTGAFGSATLKQAVKRAEKAWDEQDIIAMGRAMAELNGCE